MFKNLNNLLLKLKSLNNLLFLNQKYLDNIFL